jgi:hypothetical protein
MAAVAIGFGAAAASPALGADTIFWTTPFTSNKIYFANLDGSSTAVHALNTTGATVDKPWGVAPDPATGRIYWANYGNHKISYANLKGGGGGTLTTSGAIVKQPAGVVVDQALGKVYWANIAGIGWAKLNGTGGGNLNLSGATVDEPTGVVIDPSQARIYWTNYGGNSISSASLTGGQRRTLNITASALNEPEGIAIDPTSGKVYWANFGSSSLGFANLNGSGGSTLSTPGAAPSGVAIDPVTNSLYWSDWSGDSISVAALGGSGGRDIYSTGGDPALLALLVAPEGTGKPKLTATSHTVAAKLSCSRGSWAADDVAALDYRAPQKFAYLWEKNGAAIKGATSPTLTAKSAGNYSCTVTATNFAGSTKQKSTTVTITG